MDKCGSIIADTIPKLTLDEARELFNRNFSEFQWNIIKTGFSTEIKYSSNKEIKENSDDWIYIYSIK